MERQIIYLQFPSSARSSAPLFAFLFPALLEWMNVDDGWREWFCRRRSRPWPRPQTVKQALIISLPPPQIKHERPLSPRTFRWCVQTLELITCGGLKTSRLTTLVNISEPINNLWASEITLSTVLLWRAFPSFRRRRKSPLKWHSHTSFNPVIAFEAAYDGDESWKSRESRNLLSKKVSTLDKFLRTHPSITSCLIGVILKGFFGEKVKAKMWLRRNI